MARNTSSWMAAALLLFGCEQDWDGVDGDRDQGDRSEEMGSRQEQGAAVGATAQAMIEPVGSGQGRGSLTFTSTDSGARVLGSFTGLPKGSYELVLSQGTSCADAGSRRVDPSDAQTRGTQNGAGDQAGSEPRGAGRLDIADRRLTTVRIGDDGVAQIDENLRDLNMPPGAQGLKGHVVLLVPEQDGAMGGPPTGEQQQDQRAQAARMPVACGVVNEGSQPKPEPRG